jgi:hypothetical protein
MGYIEESLLPGERVQWRTKLHWIVFLWPAVLIFMPFVLAFANYGHEGAGGPAVAGVLMPIGLIWGACAGLSMWTSEFAITDKRVLAKAGFIRRRTIEIFVAKVESVQLHQSVLGRLLDYGTVVVAGTGASKNPLKNIEAPMEFRRALQSQMSGESVSPAPDPAPTRARPVLLMCPTCQIPVTPAKPVCPKCGQRVRLSRPA